MFNANQKHDQQIIGCNTYNTHTLPVHPVAKQQLNAYVSIHFHIMFDSAIISLDSNVTFLKLWS